MGIRVLKTTTTFDFLAIFLFGKYTTKPYAKLLNYLKEISRRHHLIFENHPNANCMGPKSCVPRVFIWIFYIHVAFITKTCSL